MWGKDVCFLDSQVNYKPEIVNPNACIGQAVIERRKVGGYNETGNIVGGGQPESRRANLN